MFVSSPAPARKCNKFFAQTKGKCTTCTRGAIIEGCFWIKRFNTLSEFHKHLADEFPDRNFDMILSCLDFKRHGCSPAKHWGENIKNLKQTAKQPAFKEIMFDIRTKVKDMFKRDAESFNILMVCGQGRHRSVAAARLVLEVLKRGGINTSGPHYLSRRYWWEGFCRKCTQCHVNANGKSEFFDTLAEEEWWAYE